MKEKTVIGNTDLKANRIPMYSSKYICLMVLNTEMIHRPLQFSGRTRVSGVNGWRGSGGYSICCIIATRQPNGAVKRTGCWDFD